MENCAHGMDPEWCYLCRIETSGVDPRSAWGLEALEDDVLKAGSTEPMTRAQAAYLRFLCDEFGYEFDPALSSGDAAVVIDSFLGEPMSGSQDKTLSWLSGHAGVEVDHAMTYGQARAQIRRLVALRGLKSA